MSEEGNTGEAPPTRLASALSSNPPSNTEGSSKETTLGGVQKVKLNVIKIWNAV